MSELNSLSDYDLSQIQFPAIQKSDYLTFAQNLKAAYNCKETSEEVCKILNLDIYNDTKNKFLKYFNWHKNVYHLYFIVDYNGSQILFEYRTDCCFQNIYKNDLQRLSNYLTYLHEKQSNINLKIYIVKLPDNNFLPTHHIFQTAKKELGFFGTAMEWIASHFKAIGVFSIFLFYTIFFGTIIAKSNIPFPAIESNFLTFLPTVLNYVIFDVIFSLEFLILLGISYVALFLYLGKVYKKIYLHHIINGSALLFITSSIAFIWTIDKFSQPEIPVETYIGATGYPKVVQSNDHNYTLLGSNNMAYDLNKSLTIDRCTQLAKLDQDEPINDFYFKLIQRVDNMTIPQAFIKIKDDNITYFDYNQSRQWVESQCKNILSKTSKTKALP